LSNCQQVVDTFLCNLKCIAPVKHSYFVPQTLLTLEEDNIIIYIVGYIYHNITKIVCCKFAAGLVDVLNKANSSRVFIAANQYHDRPTGGLVVHSSDLMEVFILIEAEFCNNIEKILHMSKVSSILVIFMLSKIQGKLECDSCYTLQFVVHLYLNIHLHHILRLNIR